MSAHRASIEWERGGVEFTYERYPRDHTWELGSGTRVEASAAPDFYGSAERVDPEEAFVAALSSCHMLTFLAIAAKKRLVVDRYRDGAVGYLEKNAEGKPAITRVVLRPQIEWAGEPPSAEQIEQLHEAAHRNCFIANSVTTDVRVESAKK